MRVVGVIPAYPPASRVGAWLSTHRYLAHLALHGDDVLVLPIYGNDRRYQLDRVTVARSIENMAAHVTGADVLVSHCGDNGVAARIAAKHGIPNVRMAHGPITDPAVLDGAALVVFNSHTLAATVDCPGPSIVCHPAVDAALFATEPGDRVTLVNLSEAKGGELFWRIARALPHRQFLGVRGHHGIQYVGRAPNVTVQATTPNMRDDVYARTRILLMPSSTETWGMVAVEAMASGIPVIAHPTPGLRESLGAAGIFVDRADGQGWVDQIERLHDPAEWANATAAALARSAALDPAVDLDRFATAIAQIGAMSCAR